MDPGIKQFRVKIWQISRQLWELLPCEASIVGIASMPYFLSDMLYRVHRDVFLNSVVVVGYTSV